jgi:hypothetical protein
MTGSAQLDREIAAAENTRAGLEAAIRYSPATGFVGLDAEIRAAAELTALKKRRGDLLNGVEVHAAPPPPAAPRKLAPDDPGYDVTKDGTPVSVGFLAEVLRILAEDHMAPLHKRVDELERKQTNTGSNPGDFEERIAALEARPTLEYLGIWEPKEYNPGNIVTHSGGMWHCRNTTRSLPPSGDWQLCVKAGRPGRDAR